MIPHASPASMGVLTTPVPAIRWGTRWGYFLRNKLALLDAPGEWYYDAGSGQLYVWCPGNANPNGQTIEAAVRDNGLYVAWQRHDLNVSICPSAIRPMPRCA